MKYLKKGMSVIELQKLKRIATSDKQKERIDKQIKRVKEGNKIFVDSLLKSKWFKLGITQTIKKGQAERLLIAQTVVYELDPHDVMLNLIDLTIKGEKRSRKGFSFTEELGKL